MIPTPQFSQFPIDAFVMGGLGYALSCFNGVDEKLGIGIFVIASLANQILFHAVNYCVSSKLEISASAIYTGTNAAVTMTAIIAARHLELISRRLVGIFMFASLAVLAARLKILAD